MMKNEKSKTFNEKPKMNNEKRRKKTKNEK